MNAPDKNNLTDFEEAMSISDKKVGRRAFIKISCCAGALVTARPVLKSIRPKCCNYCQIELAEPLTVSSSGNCRNCGANAITGQLNLPARLIPESDLKGLHVFDQFVEVPFPHPGIQHLTHKPCASAIELKPGVSRIRPRINTIRA
jgi:hypothetical protein